MTAGQDVTPKDHEAVARLKAYWARGEGADQIGWGKDGDFDRCRVLIQQAVVKNGNKPLGDRMLSGLCANLHKAATGEWPGHAPGESKDAVHEAAKKAAH
jgi:phosphomannomutase